MSYVGCAPASMPRQVGLPSETVCRMQLAANGFCHVVDEHGYKVRIEAPGRLGAVKQKRDCGPWISDPASFSAVASAHPSFRPHLQALLADLQAAGLPFEITAVKRSKDKQCHAICRGASKLTYPESSAHIKGLAADFKLKLSERKNGEPLWHTGYDRDKRIVTDSRAVELWKAFGLLVQNFHPELKWGGEFGKRSGDPFGWDPFHVELDAYRDYVPTTKSYKCATTGPARAVPIESAAERAQASAEAFAQERPASVGIGAAAAIAGGVGLWWVWRRYRSKR